MRPGNTAQDERSKEFKMGTSVSIIIPSHFLTSAAAIASRGSRPSMIYFHANGGVCHVVALDMPSCTVIYRATKDGDGSTVGVWLVNPADVVNARLLKSDYLRFEGQDFSVLDKRMMPRGHVIPTVMDADAPVSLKRLDKYLEHTCYPDSIVEPFITMSPRVLDDLRRFLAVGKETPVRISHVVQRSGSYETTFTSEHDGALLQYVCLLKAGA